MKNLIALIGLLTTSVVFVNFTLVEESTSILDISGKWKLTIDNNIDENVSGNNGCEVITFTASEANSFVGKYAKCSGSNNAKSSRFSGQTFTTNRGNLINMIQDNFDGTQYYASWAGRMDESGEIRGIWTDVEGNQGEFKLTR